MEQRKLKAWLAAERGRNARLAARMGVQPGHLSQMANGTRPVPHESWQQIETETQGQVTRQDIWPKKTCAAIWPELASAKARG